MRNGNGQSAEKMAEAQRESAEQQYRQSLQQMGIQQAMRQAEEIQNDLLQEISNSDLQADSKQLLRNLVSKDFIFANLTDAEVTEFKYKLLLKRKAFYAMHPSAESIVEGDFRAYVYDDERNTLESLTQQQKLIVDQFFEGVWMRVTRARGMRQQEILKTQINQSMTGNLGDDSGSSGGLLGRWRS